MKQRLLVFLALCLLTACLPQRTAPVLKIGLLGPFEGERRELGYHLLPAIRAATPERVQGRRVEWVILDTQGDPATAAQRARELVVDPAVLAIVGPLVPNEAAAVAPIVEEAGMAWWPLAPVGEVALREWQGALGASLASGQGWGPLAWPAIRRGEADLYLDPTLPADLGDFAAVAGDAPWPQDWLAWQGSRLAFDAMERATPLDRPTVRAAATPLDIPPPVLYRSIGGSFPGVTSDE